MALERHNDAVANKADRQQAAQLARRFLAAVERDELDADALAAPRILRRLGGAVAEREAETLRKAGTDKP